MIGCLAAKVDVTARRWWTSSLLGAITVWKLGGQLDDDIVAARLWYCSSGCLSLVMLVLAPLLQFKFFLSILVFLAVLAVLKVGAVVWCLYRDYRRLSKLL